jgi:flavin reductase (DIM6/NTAB) family NADH-FMN oxidoreductase RutF
VVPAHASRLINHGPTVLVTSAHAGRRNIMAAAWSMPVEFTSPRVAVVIDTPCAQQLLRVQSVSQLKESSRCPRSQVAAFVAQSSTPRQSSQ